jgi:hypothetical protein
MTIPEDTLLLLRRNNLLAERHCGRRPQRHHLVRYDNIATKRQRFRIHCSAPTSCFG